MIAKKVVESDAFLDMPLSAQALYFHLNFAADDDGFVNNPKKIRRSCGASEDDFKLLLLKNFIIHFESGIIVIKHWKIHNYIQKDRYKPTDYQEEKSLLTLKDTKEYAISDDLENVSVMDTECIQDVSVGKVRLGKDRLGKDRLDNIYCSEPSKKDSEPVADVEAIILNSGEEWRPTVSEYEEYVRLYPRVNVFDEFAKMRGWCLSNPAKRKTSKGVKRFVNGWLAREQDRGGQVKQTNVGNTTDILRQMYEEEEARNSGQKGNH